MDFALEKDTRFFYLDCHKQFEALTEKEQKYAYYLALASWAGCPIILHQVSHEAPEIFALVQRLFRPVPPKYPTAASLAAYLSESGASAEGFLQYFGSFLGSLGNYSTSTSKKFIPSIPRAEFRRCVELLAGLHGAAASAEIVAAYDGVEDIIYAVEPAALQQIGIDEEGVTSYYTKDLTGAEVALVQRCLEAHNIRSENTRVAKVGDKSYRVRIASARVSAAPLAEYDFEGAHIAVCDGGFSAYLTEVVAHLREARKYAGNELQERMLDAYIKHFEEGDLEDHKESQRIWVKDRAPPVETNIGFVETYGDPIGVRAEWEGWVAVTNKVTGKAYADLVERSGELLGRLPWGPAFEKSVFIKPDFLAIDIFSFCTTALPQGINVPNYDDVREQDGFKNVFLLNVTTIAFGTGEEGADTSVIDVSFVSDEDAAVLVKSRARSFDIDVGLHELLGHGSGKLLTEDAAGNRNFDPAAVVSPLTGKPVDSWYKPGQTYDSVLKEIASPMEECRAEAVGLFLSTDADVLRIFGHVPPADKSAVHDVTYANWLGMTRDCLLRLSAYNPETRKWGQAHIQARYAIMRQLMRFGVAKIELLAEDGLRFSLDRSKILTDGLAAIKDLLVHLQVFRATGDYEGAKKYFAEGLCTIDLDDPLMGEVFRRAKLVKKPTRQIVQGVPALDEKGCVKITSYEGSPVGMIQSFQDRFPVDVINHNEVI